VSIEAAQLASQGTVFAIEPDPGDLALIAANCEAFGVPNVRSVAAGATSRWRLGSSVLLTSGVDWSHQQRRAVRTTAGGRDYIWPDAVYDDAGVFVETVRTWAPFWSLRFGLRGDRVGSDARDADRLALGRSIREQFVAYNGPAASTVARVDLVGAANVQLRWTHGPSWEIFCGTGISDMPAPVTERYRAFLNALGGDGHGGNAVELGNPALYPERNGVIEFGGIWNRPTVVGEARIYCYRIDNFILRTPIGTTQAPLPRMLVFGYRNVDATLYGGEVSLTWKPSSHWTFPTTLARAEGKRRDTGTGLADMPPWEATFGARYHVENAFPMSLELGARTVGAKTNPAPQDNPLFANADPFTVWHARVEFAPWPRLRLGLGVNNLFNRRYTEYLTPPVSPVRPATGTLRPGDRVPAPGRSVVASLSWFW